MSIFSDFRRPALCLGRIRLCEKAELYDIKPIADKITQDMLTICANQNHFIDHRLVSREINMLKNVHGLTFQLFADKEDAQNHCNVGNGKLALDFICGWISQINGEKQ